MNGEMYPPAFAFGYVASYSSEDAATGTEKSGPEKDDHHQSDRGGSGAEK
jgi:hypothetical protein